MKYQLEQIENGWIISYDSTVGVIKNCFKTLEEAWEFIKEFQIMLGR